MKQNIKRNKKILGFIALALLGVATIVGSYKEQSDIAFSTANAATNNAPTEVFVSYEDTLLEAAPDAAEVLDSANPENVKLNPTILAALDVIDSERELTTNQDRAEAILIATEMIVSSDDQK